MNGLFVGQRVRIIGATDPEAKFLIGRETVITGRGQKNYLGVPLNRVAIPAPALPNCSGWWAFPDFQLEPITDANDKLAWTDERCVWTPEHLRATHA